jgi:hypothetical protein
MRIVPFAVAIAAACISGSLAFAADDSMAMKGAMSGPMATSSGYRFELAGPPKSSGGKSLVSVKIVHEADKKPVVGAIIIQSRADMAPIGMAEMTAPIKATASTTPGVYTFEVANGPVWKKPDKWSLSFAAKVQGEAQTIRGSLIVQLNP